MYGEKHKLARLDLKGKFYSILVIHTREPFYTGPFCPENTILHRLYWVDNMRNAELRRIELQGEADRFSHKHPEFIVVPVTVDYIDPGEWQEDGTYIPSIEVLREEVLRRQLLLLGAR